MVNLRKLYIISCLFFCLVKIINCQNNDVVIPIIIVVSVIFGIILIALFVSVIVFCVYYCHVKERDKKMMSQNFDDIKEKENEKEFEQKKYDHYEENKFEQYSIKENENFKNEINENNSIKENRIYFIEEKKLSPIVNKKSKHNIKLNKKFVGLKNTEKTIRNTNSYMGIAKTQGIKFLRLNTFKKSTRKVYNSSKFDVFAIENESQA